MKLIKRTLPLLLTGMVLSAPSFASNPDTWFVARHCTDIVHKIHDLIHAQSNVSACVGDLDVASAYVESAEMSIHHEKFEQASIVIRQASNELTEISMYRPYCVNLAPDVRPILADVIRVQGEIETLKRLKASS